MRSCGAPSPWSPFWAGAGSCWACTAAIPGSSAGTRPKSGKCVLCRPSSVALTPAQRVTAWFFLVVAVLFLLQNLIGGATVHYMVETGGFFGIDLPKYLPYNLTRTWHLQMAIFFVATAYLAAGIFLAPLIAGREPRGQGLLAALLLGALAVVVFGSLGGEFLSYHGLLPRGLTVGLRSAGMGIP